MHNNYKRKHLHYFLSWIYWINK